MPIRVYYEVLNQKGSPAVYADNYAQRPAAGYAGRIFYSPDTAQIFYDTGSTWTLLADAGVGSGSLASVCANGNTTATGISITAGGLSSNSITNTSNTAGSVLFAGAGGAESQSNATFFWDNTNKRLGLGNAAPGVTLDIHGTGGTLVQLNGTGTNNAYLQFQNAGVGKWRIGNLYNAGANTFQIYNNALANYAMQVNSDSTINFISNISAVQGNFSDYILTQTAALLKNTGSVSNLAGYSSFSGNAAGNGFTFAPNNTNYQTFIVPTGVNYTYTLPSATGTLALTSNLSSYLPLAGGTLTGGLTINSTLYINPTNTGLTGLDVASNTTSFRSDNLEGSKRQLTITMASGTLISLTGQGYGAARITDIGFYTSSASSVNSSPAIYMTGTNSYVGIGLGSPNTKLHVSANGTYSSNWDQAQMWITGTDTAQRLQLGYDTTNNYSIIQSIQGGVSVKQLLLNPQGGKIIINDTVTDGYLRVNTKTTTAYNPNAYNGANSNIDLTNGSAAVGAFSGIRFTGSGSTEGFYGVVQNSSNYAEFVWQTYNGSVYRERMRLAADGYLTVEGNGNGWTIGQASGVNRIDYTSSTFRCLSSANAYTPIAASAFNVNSDYRLKEDLKDFSNELDLINSIKIYDFKWKDREERNFGVLAHELKSIIPYVVYGEKDAVNENGEQITQGVDYGKLVPITIKAIQNIDKRLTALEQTLN